MNNSTYKSNNEESFLKSFGPFTIQTGGVSLSKPRQAPVMQFGELLHFGEVIVYGSQPIVDYTSSQVPPIPNN